MAWIEPSVMLASNFSSFGALCLRLLRPGGLLIVEIGWQAAGQVQDTLREWGAVEALPDLAGIPRVVMGENRTFLGAEDLLLAHGVEVVNLDVPACAAMMREFIDAHPDVWNEDIGA